MTVAGKSLAKILIILLLMVGTAAFLNPTGFCQQLVNDTGVGKLYLLELFPRS